MIVKRRSELEVMAEAAVINREALEVVERAVTPGVTTRELNALAEDAILSRGGKPAFKGYNGFPPRSAPAPTRSSSTVSRTTGRWRRAT